MKGIAGKVAVVTGAACGIGESAARRPRATRCWAAIICLSLVVITGFVGQISIVQLALAGIAAFTLSHMATDHGIGFRVAPLIGIAAAAVGLLTAVSALRVRGADIKLTAFGVAAGIAGTAGALIGYNFNFADATKFTALNALGLIAFAYVGGITMVSGAIFAGLISTQALFPYAFERWFGLAGNWALLVGGLALIVNLVLYPEGVAGTMWLRKQQKLKRRAAQAADLRAAAATPVVEQ